MNGEEWERALSVFKPYWFKRVPASAPDKPLSRVDNFLNASSSLRFQNVSREGVNEDDFSYSNNYFQLVNVTFNTFSFAVALRLCRMKVFKKINSLRLLVLPSQSLNGVIIRQSP